MAEKLPRNNASYACRFIQRLDARRSAINYDCKIVIKNRVIEAERNILACASEYFDTRFSTGVGHSAQSLEISGLDYESVKACIDFIYGREVLVRYNQYYELMNAASMLVLEDLCYAVEEQMYNKLSSDNIYLFSCIAWRFDRLKLREKCRNFIKENPNAIKEKRILDKIDKTLMETFLKCTLVESESTKAEIVDTWANCDAERVEMMQHVNVDQIPRAFIQSNPHIFRNVNSRSDNHERETCGGITPSKIIIFDRKRHNLSVLSCPEDECVELSISKPRSVEHYSAVHVSGHIYVFGSDKSCLRYPYTKSGSPVWQKLGDMNFAHGWRPPAVVVGQFIYVIGSYDQGCSSAVERYNQVTDHDQWRVLPEVQQILKSAEVLECGGSVYSFGGEMNGEPVNSVSKLDLELEAWQPLEPMLEKKSYAAAAVSLGAIFVAGGLSNQDHATLERYCLTTGSWSRLAPMNSPRSWFRLFSTGSCLYAMGRMGGEEGGKEDNIEKYDIDNNMWTELFSTESMFIEESVVVNSNFTF